MGEGFVQQLLAEVELVCLSLGREDPLVARSCAVEVEAEPVALF